MPEYRSIPRGPSRISPPRRLGAGRADAPWLARSAPPDCRVRLAEVRRRMNQIEERGAELVAELEHNEAMDEWLGLPTDVVADLEATANRTDDPQDARYPMLVRDCQVPDFRVR